MLPPSSPYGLQIPRSVLQASEFWLRHAMSNKSAVLGVDVGRMKTGLALLDPVTGVCEEVGTVRVAPSHPIG